MFSHQQDSPMQETYYQTVPIRHPLLRHHPIGYAIAMLGGAVLLITASFSIDTHVQLFAGISISIPCLFLGIVIGISGMLAGIIGTLQRLDERPSALAYQPERQSATGAMEVRDKRLTSKEHRYDCN